MNMLHAIKRALGLHPLRREGEPNARSTADVLAAIRADRTRRHTDAIDGPVNDRVVC